MYCGKCGNKIKDGYKFCLHCSGSEKDFAENPPRAGATMYCGNCGTKVSCDDCYCPKCGKKLKSIPSPPEGPSLWEMLAIPALWLLHKIQELLKNMDSKKMIGIICACLALVIVIALIGNLAGGYEKKVLGDWYEDGSSMLEFTLYDDGKCKIGYSLQEGTWSISDKNLLHISSYWGQNRVFTIVSASSEKLVLAQHYAGGPGTMEPVTYWHTPHR